MDDNVVPTSEISNLSTPSTPVASEDLTERYNKLKTIAVKLKKRIAEQNTEIESLKEDKSRFQNASKIQQEFDKAQDEIESLKKSEKTMQKDLEKSIEDSINLKMTNAELTSQVQSLSSSHKALRERLDKLEKENVDTEELKTKSERLEIELQEAKNAGVDAQQEKRQLVLLSLEVTDYEKKLADAYGSLEEKKAEYEGLLKELDLKDDKIQELENQILDYKKIEDQLTLSKESFQAEVSRKTEKVIFLQDEVSKFNERLSEKKLELQKLEQEFNNSKASFSAQVKELLEKCAKSDKVISNLELKITSLEENKRSRESHIANLKLEMEQLESDYSNYKVKAQAMLKSQKPVDLKDENDEIETLHKSLQDFHSEVAILKSELQTKKLENENFFMEKTELNIRLSQLRTDAIEKEVQMNNELERLKNDLRLKDKKLKSEKEESRHEIERAVASFKTQLDTTKQDYESQIHKLREKAEILPENAVTENKNMVDVIYSLDRDTSVGSEFRPITRDQNSPFVSQPLAIDTSNIAFDQMRMIPRGEGEGSESVVSTYTSRIDNYNISFEQLLSTSFDSISKNSDSDQEKTPRDEFSYKDEITRSQSQINHLTGLLRESESNCDRLTQLSDALKEEIRRIERDKERQAHLKENTEYLKNIVIKFVTLNGEDERQRLIPVLKTMLRLTSEEVMRLEKATKGSGKDCSQKDSSSWSSYLPTWSSASSAGDKG